jgi:hypothetical protein
MKNPQGGGGPYPSTLADQIAATTRPYPRRVQRAGRHVTSFASATSPALASHRQSHLSAQNDVRRFHRMRVIGIRHIRAILPHIGVAESFLLKRSRKLLFIHDPIPPNVHHFPPEDGYALPAALGDTAERARPSSGEKTVTD